MSYADSVWLGGTIYTVDRNFSVATALAVRGERILAVGSDEEIEVFVGPDTTVRQLDGATVVPGFIEGHIHLDHYGGSLERLVLRDRSKEQILADVAEAIKRLPPGQWLEGGMGWNNEVWEDPSYPTRDELDRVAPDHPVLLPRMDGHMIWVNSKALEAAGIGEDVANPSGGEFLRDETGRLSGCINNAAANLVRRMVPLPDKATIERQLCLAQRQLLSYGVTSVNDMSTGMGEIEALCALYERGEYRIRFHGALRDAGKDCAPEALKAYYREGPHKGLYNGHFTVRAVKILGDGSVGAQSACLYEDYADRPGHRGTMMQTGEELDRLVLDAHKRGYQVITHAIGDATIDRVLEAYGKALQELPNPDHRFRVEHFQLVTGDSRERAKALGVVASMQPTHAPDSAKMAVRRLGEDRAGRAYALGMVLDVMGMVAGGSDAPVARPIPLDGIHSAVTRQNSGGKPEGGFHMENAISREQALRAYTIWGAYAQFEEMDKGSLEPGKLADFAVLDRDVMKVPNDELLRIRVVETVIGGEPCL